MSSNLLHDLKEIVSLAAGVMALVIYIISLGYMLYSPFYIIHYINRPDFYNILYVLVPIPVGIVELDTFAAYGWYIFLIIAVSISAYFMFRKGVLQYIKSVASDMFSYKHNPFQDAVELLSLSLFVTVVTAFLYSLLTGTEPYTPSISKIPLYERMMLLLNASVYEELITRTVFLGIPLFIYYKFKNKDISVIKIFGGTEKIGSVEIFFILLSAIIFGVAHVPGWTWWKFFPAFVAGLVLGYVYVKYGIYASITMHFLNDFSSIPAEVYPQYTLVYSLIMMGLIIAGVVFLISRLIRVLQFFGVLKRPSATPEPVLPPPPPPPWVFPEEFENITTTPNMVLPSSDGPSVDPHAQRNVIGEEENTNLFPIPRNFTPSTTGDEWINITCPVCGGTEFRYEGKGKLRCVQCGKIIEVHEYQEQSHQ